MSSTDLKNMAGQGVAKSKNLLFRVADADSQTPQAADLKFIVQEKYGQIARANAGTAGCCGSSGCCGELEFIMIGDEYTAIEGHFSEADLGLGCGTPTQFANLQPGQSLLDLGSGAGNDCFVARKIVGDSGMVTGLDFTPAMVEKAIQIPEKVLQNYLSEEEARDFGSNGTGIFSITLSATKQ